MFNKDVPENQTFFKIVNSYNPFSPLKIISINGKDVIFDRRYIEKKSKQRVYTSIENLFVEKEIDFKKNYNSNTLFKDIVIKGFFNSLFFIFNNLFKALKLFLITLFKLILLPVLPFVLIAEYIKIKKYDIFLKNNKNKKK